MNSPRVTIRQVAEQAGVSLASVSSALNGKPGMVSAQTQARIIAIAQNLGYRPNRKARQLRRQSNLTLSIQIDSNAISSPSERPTLALSLLMLQGINTYALRQGYHLHLLMPKQDRDVETFEEQVLRENAVDGVIFMGYKPTTLSTSRLKQLIAKLKALSIPAVTFNHRVATCGIPAVLTNLDSAIESAVQCMVRRGHRRVGYIGIARQSGHEMRFRSRFELFQDALNRSGIQMDPECIRVTTFEFNAYRETLAMIDSGRCPSCLIYSSDHLAVAGMQALEDRGLEPGRDISVVGCDYAPYARGLPIELATIDQRFVQRGELLAKLLLDQVRHPADPVSECSIVDATFVDGPSLGAWPSTRDPNLRP